MSANYSLATKSLKATVAAINGAGGIVNKIVPAKKLDEKAMITAAISKANGLRDFGPGDPLASFHQLVQSIENEASLSTVGRVVVKQWLTDVLKFRLLFEDHWKKNPQLENVTVKKPLFILGLPRTGTTILHLLLAQDKKLRAPLTWECLAPMPKPRENIALDKSREKQSDRYLNALYTLAPELLSIHEVRGGWPQECNIISEFNFMSINYAVQYHIPSYQRWLLEQSCLPAIQFHKRFLQYLQHSGNETWILKSPGHLGVMEAIFEVYPDARIIQTHRNPAEAIGSIASLSKYTRKIYSKAAESCDSKVVGEDAKEFWSGYLKKAVNFRNNNMDKQDQIYDFQYSEFLADPIKGVQNIYEYFDMPFSDDAAQNMTSFLKSNAQNKHGKHVYTLEEFGYSKEGLDKEFKFYCDYLDMAQQ